MKILNYFGRKVIDNVTSVSGTCGMTISAGSDYVEIQRKKLNEAELRSLEDISSDEVWKPVRRSDGAANLMNKETGEYLSPEWFNWCGYMYDGISVVRNNNNKYNYLKDDGSLILDKWYDDCQEFTEKSINGSNKVMLGKVIRDKVVDGKRVSLYRYVARDGNFLGDWKLAR